MGKGVAWLLNLASLGSAEGFRVLDDVSVSSKACPEPNSLPLLFYGRGVHSHHCIPPQCCYNRPLHSTVLAFEEGFGRGQLLSRERELVALRKAVVLPFSTTDLATRTIKVVGSSQIDTAAAMSANISKIVLAHSSSSRSPAQCSSPSPSLPSSAPWPSSLSSSQSSSP